METMRVNEEDSDANYVIELLVDNKWKYITTEFSISVATVVMSNLHNATKQKCRVLSRRSNNQVLAQI